MSLPRSILETGKGVVTMLRNIGWIIATVLIVAGAFSGVVGLIGALALVGTVSAMWWWVFGPAT